MTRVRACRVGAVAGFTIIELGIVLAIMSVIATVVVPNFIELTKNDLARQAADQVQVVQDAARSFYLASIRDPARNINDPTMAIWPGESYPNECPEIGVDPMAVLFDYDMLKPNQAAPRALVNQWGRPIEARLRQARSPAPDSQFAGGSIPARTLCTMVVSTEVPLVTGTNDPQALGNIVRTYLPGARCNAPGVCGPTAALGFVRCCSLIPKPGLSVSMMRSMVEERVRTP